MSGERFPEGYTPLYDTGHRTDDSDRRPLSHFNDEDIARLYNQTRYGIRGGEIKYFKQDDDDSNDITGTLPDRYFEPGDGGIYSQRRGDGDAPRRWGDVADQLPFGVAQSDDQVYKMFDAVTDEFLARQLENMPGEEDDGGGDTPDTPTDPVDDPGDGGGGSELDSVRRGMNFVLQNAVGEAYPEEYSGTKQFAIENYPFFAPYNRESSDAFKGVNYLGPDGPVQRNPFSSFVDSRYDGDGNQYPENDFRDGYRTERDNQANMALNFLEQLKQQFGLG